MGSSFPDQGSNLCPLHWQREVLTTGPAGKFPPHLSCVPSVCRALPRLYYLGQCIFCLCINQGYFLNEWLLIQHGIYNSGIIRKIFSMKAAVPHRARDPCRLRGKVKHKTQWRVAWFTSITRDYEVWLLVYKHLQTPRSSNSQPMLVLYTDLF